MALTYFFHLYRKYAFKLIGYAKPVDFEKYGEDRDRRCSPRSHRLRGQVTRAPFDGQGPQLKLAQVRES